MGLRVTDLTKGYTRRGDHHQALRGVSFEAPKGAFVTLLGPSGCGKSTLLNMLAGLDKPSGGRIDISGCNVFDSGAAVFVPAAGRNISMVFQSYAIWPHMTVRENVAFPLLNGRQRRRNRAELERATDAALKKVHLDHLADRPAPLLSGGQQQRVALARAIAQSPDLILLDEPLSNLDANLRDAMQKQIREVVSKEGITTVYVTHDQKEALAMSDTIIVMNDGRIEQVGTPHQIYYQPGTRFVAQFMGAPNLLEATVEQVNALSGEALAHSALGPVVFLHREASLKAGDKVTLVLRQEDFQLVAADGPRDRPNRYSMAVERCVFLGERMEVVCRAPAGAGQTVSAYVNARAMGANASHVELHYPPEKIHCIEE